MTSVLYVSTSFNEAENISTQVNFPPFERKTVKLPRKYFFKTFTEKDLFKLQKMLFLLLKISGIALLSLGILLFTRGLIKFFFPTQF